MIQLSPQPIPGPIDLPRGPGFALAGTSDFALALSQLVGPSKALAAPATPPESSDAAVLVEAADGQLPAGDGKLLPTAMHGLPILGETQAAVVAAVPRVVPVLADTVVEGALAKPAADPPAARAIVIDAAVGDPAAVVVPMALPAAPPPPAAKLSGDTPADQKSSDIQPIPDIAPAPAIPDIVDRTPPTLPVGATEVAVPPPAVDVVGTGALRARSLAGHRRPPAASAAQAPIMLSGKTSGIVEQSSITPVADAASVAETPVIADRRPTPSLADPIVAVFSPAAAPTANAAGVAVPPPIADAVPASIAPAASVVTTVHPDTPIPALSAEIVPLPVAGGRNHSLPIIEPTPVVAAMVAQSVAAVGPGAKTVAIPAQPLQADTPVSPVSEPTSGRASATPPIMPAASSPGPQPGMPCVQSPLAEPAASRSGGGAVAAVSVVVAVASPRVAPPVVTPQPAAQAFAAAIFAAERPAVSRERGDPIADGFPLSQIAAAPPADPIAVHAPAAGREPVLDLARHDWMGAMIEHIETLRDDGGARETRMRLAPDALGTVDIAIRHDESGSVRIHIAAETPQARAILADAAPRLADMVEARGLKLGGASVDTAAGSQAGADPGGREGRQGAARAPTRPPAADTDTSAIVDSRIA